MLTCFLAVAAAPAAEPAVEALWPKGAPGGQAVAEPERYDNGLLQNVHTPTLTVYLPPKEMATGAGVVICPGGGYWLLAIDHEGKEIAQWLDGIGVAGFVLKYRHRDYKHPIPLQDAQRAVRLVRHRCAEWGIDPQRIGILGFSAGGHLASTAGTHFTAGAPEAEDPVDRVSSRPDFMILVYPVISSAGAHAHRGSIQNLLGKDPDEKLVRYLSSELQVTPETPPSFLVHASDDTAVPPENSIGFYLALSKAKVPAELHIYESGGHGFGMRANRGAAATDWPKRCADWMKGRWILERKKQ